MKRFYLMLLVCLMASGISAYAQKNYIAAQITFNDGSSRQGIVKNFSPEDKKLKFKASEEAKVEKLLAEDIMMVQVPTVDGDIITLESMKLQGRRKNLLVRRLIEGPLSLYHMQVYSGNLGLMDHYILKRSTEEECTVIVAMTIGARKHTKRYFEDCPSLVEKIESRELVEIPDMVEFYNKTMVQSKR